MILNLHKIMNEMINYFNKDVKRINHALKVYSFCNTIGALEQISETEMLTVSLSGILHDIGIKEAEKKYGSSAGPYQEKEGPAIAGEILRKFDIDAGIAERVCYIVGHHHTYNKIDGTDFQILVEADFLVNIFEDGMDKTSVESIKSKYFKTKAGTELLESMYL
ncbi:MAG TPA: HD domain-containing protein [Ruminiclostridium sp.]|nr:HD domain-containing protein [Ruminiclostridium sp.]